jgi:hypothetical protein
MLVLSCSSRLLPALRERRDSEATGGRRDGAKCVRGQAKADGGGLRGRPSACHAQREITFPVYNRVVTVSATVRVAQSPRLYGYQRGSKLNASGKPPGRTARETAGTERPQPRVFLRRLSILETAVGGGGQGGAWKLPPSPRGEIRIKTPRTAAAHTSISNHTQATNLQFHSSAPWP